MECYPVYIFMNHEFCILILRPLVHILSIISMLSILHAQLQEHLKAITFSR
jgi:hypothetical protein